jgi:hypothetical protein
LRGIDKTVKRVSVKARERVVESELVRRIEALGGVCEKVASLGQRGFPDRICFLPDGIIALVEVKRPRGGVLSVHQKWWRDKLAMLGTQIEVVKNFDDIDSLIRKLSGSQTTRRGKAA